MRPAGGRALHCPRAPRSSHCAEPAHAAARSAYLSIHRLQPANGAWRGVTIAWRTRWGRRPGQGTRQGEGRRTDVVQHRAAAGSASHERRESLQAIRWCVLLDRWLAQGRGGPGGAPLAREGAVTGGWGAGVRRGTVELLPVPTRAVRETPFAPGSQWAYHDAPPDESQEGSAVRLRHREQTGQVIPGFDPLCAGGVAASEGLSSRPCARWTHR